MALSDISPSGVATAFLYGTQTGGGPGYSGIIGAVPPNVNTPIFYEPDCDLSGNRLLLWIVVTGPGPNFGGAQVWASADGTTYGQLGGVGQGGVQGVLTATFPSGSDPDTANTLSVDVTESSGTITAGSDTDADLGITLGYVNGSTPELIGYSAATLTSPGNYDLDTYIRRGMFGTSVASHSSGADFALLNQNVFAYVYPKQFVGQTVSFKFPSFNTVGGSLQDISTVPVYTYTLTGNGVCDNRIKCRVFTSGPTATLNLGTDYLLIVSKASGSATGVDGPALPVPDGTRFEVQDAGNGGLGDSDYNNITFTPAGGVQVNGASNYILQSRGGKIVMTYCSGLGQWTASTQV